MNDNSDLQYIRKATLVVSDAQGDGLDLSDLRIVFNIKKSDTDTPNATTIRVYNLSENTITQIEEQFTLITFQAGYQSNFGLIFKGNIKQVKRGRENAVDSYIDIAAGDGDDAYNFSIINKTLASGSTQLDQINAAAQSMDDNGTTLGFVGDTGASSLSRGKVMFGMSRDYLKQSADSTSSTWSIQDGVINIIPKTGVLPGTAVAINSKSGMINFPELTNEGVKVTSLLNPLLKVGGTIQINNENISDQTIASSGSSNTVNSPPSKAADGIYRILVVEYSGDTRGNDWYAHITCLATDETASPGSEVSPL